MSGPFVSQVETGIRSASFELLQGLAVAGVSTDWLLTGEGPMLREDRAHARGPDQAPTDPRRAELLDAVNAWWDGADEDERAWLKVHLRHTVPGFDKPPKT